MKLSLVVDGKAQSVDADPAMPLLYALRDDLGLNNPKFGCGRAQCGACTVHVDGIAESEPRQGRCHDRPRVFIYGTQWDAGSDGMRSRSRSTKRSRMG